MLIFNRFDINIIMMGVTMAKLKAGLEVTILNNIGSNLQFIKNQQWRISHYVLIIYGVVIAIKENYDKCENSVLIGLASITFLAAILINIKLVDSLYKHRGFVTNIYKKNKDQVEGYGIPIDQTIGLDYISLSLFCAATIGYIITMVIITCV